MNELALFAGVGGGILGGLLCGFKTVCAVEIEPFCREVLLRRQMDGVLPRFPIWDDIKTFKGKPWRGRIDIVTGGFPCQDISCAGTGKGLSGARSGLWVEMARIIEEVQPQWVFIENSPNLRNRGLATVLEDLARMGYSARWGVLGARNVGAPHRRNRIWVVAHANRFELREQSRGGSRTCRKETLQSPINGEIWAVADTTSNRRRQGRKGRFVTGSSGKQEQSLQDVSHTESEQMGSSGQSWRSVDVGDANEIRWNGGSWEKPEAHGRRQSTNTSWWDVEPELDRVANGIPHQVDRIRSLGNAQVPEVARLAWEILSHG